MFRRAVKPTSVALSAPGTVYGTVAGHEKWNFPGTSSGGQGGNGLSFFSAAMSFWMSGSEPQVWQNGPLPRITILGELQDGACHLAIVESGENALDSGLHQDKVSGRLCRSTNVVARALG